MGLFEERLERFISCSKELLTNEGIAAIMHYYCHDEYEMAYEGLLIELTIVGHYPSQFVFIDWKELGEHYGLDKETVFDELKWEKFMQWGKSFSARNF
ncbi:hypothetical protein DVH26_10025 [Paenibacillus sp. H1-7]|uniref:hypothetical protein n=1 Tax=Paenibacillus sp. H1-7 TaxID=2282849 RepID=UPI001EF82E16|nr:hypothetical protein [Paenibacillus sp. H1-7]ULL14757.1 hypothetical protein DVH26_10025 [Paenibacillus sp. H1-7]